jgi:hypothetical protein
MTTYDPEDQNERRRVLLNDARVREQSRNGEPALTSAIPIPSSAVVSQLQIIKQLPA